MKQTKVRREAKLCVRHRTIGRNAPCEISWRLLPGFSVPTAQNRKGVGNSPTRLGRFRITPCSHPRRSAEDMHNRLFSLCTTRKHSPLILPVPSSPIVVKCAAVMSHSLCIFPKAKDSRPGGGEREKHVPKPGAALRAPWSDVSDCRPSCSSWPRSPYCSRSVTPCRRLACR